MYTDNDFIRLDWAAKYILRDKADFEIFEGLMTVLLGEPIKIIELLESESNRENKNARSNRVDIKATNSKGEIILVEIQLEHEMYFMERILFGVSKTIIEHIGMGQKYDHVKKVYSINIIYFNLGHGSDYLYHGTNRFVGVNTGDTLVMREKESRGFAQPKDADIFPEYYIIRVNQFEKKEIDSPLDEWMRYLQSGYIKPDTTVPGLQKARQKLRVLSMSDKDREEYEYYLYNKVYEEDLVETARWDGRKEGLAEGMEKGLAEGMEKGLAEGLEQGKAKTMEEVTERLRALGMDDDTIAKITNLD